MWYNREIDVLRIQYFSSVVPDVSASGQLNVFSCVVVTYIVFSHVHKCFRVSGLGILARARGNFICNNILRHTFTQFAIRWAGM